jgi:hypothetical protein
MSGSTVPAAGREVDRSDRRVLLVALAAMLGLVLFGVGYGALFAATECRTLRPVARDVGMLTVPTDGAGVDAGTDALDAALLVQLEDELGPVTGVLALPLDAPLRLAAHGGGVLVTGDGLVHVREDGSAEAVGFRRGGAVTVVGDGPATYALVVGNTITGQSDALRPLLPGVDGIEPGTCVDTSAVGSPLSFVHDAREGQLLGLRTDEDGSDVLVELRDAERGRIWAPPIVLPRAPAGLQGSRTSGAIGPDLVVVARRIADADDETERSAAAVLGLARADGSLRFTLSPADVRAALPSGAVTGPADRLAEEPALRIAVVEVDQDVVTLVVFPDVGPDELLPLPAHGPLGALADAHPRSVTLTLDASDGRVLSVAVGAAATDRDGAERAALRSRVSGLLGELAGGGRVIDVLETDRHLWLLLEDALVRIGSS